MDAFDRFKERAKEQAVRLRAIIVKAMAERSKNANKNEVTVPSMGKALTIFIFGAVLFAILYYVSPISKIVDAFFGVYLQQWIVTLLPNQAAFISQFFIPFTILVVFIIILIWALVVRHSLSVFFYDAGLTLSIIDIFFILALVLWSGLLNYSVLDPYICTTQNLVTFRQFSPELAQRCAQYVQSQLPEFQKKGTATPVEVSFGYEVNGQQYIPTIFQGQVYSLSITVKNLDQEEDLQGVVVKGYLENDTCYPGVDCLSFKTIGSCSDESPCAIFAKGTQTVSLQTDGPVTDKRGSFLKYHIIVSYPEVAYGSGVFYIARNAYDAAILQFNKPQSKTGPLDVVIYFSPQFYLSTYGGTSEIMYVGIANNGKGTGRLENIVVDRVGTFAQLDKASCPVPWHIGEGDTITEGSVYDLQHTAITKNSNIQVACSLNINPDVACALLSGCKDPSKGITFTSTVNYVYFDTAIYDAPQPVQSLQIGGGGGGTQPKVQ